MGSKICYFLNDHRLEAQHVYITLFERGEISDDKKNE